MSTYTPIASQTLSSAAASITFSSIPQGYTDLVLVVNGEASTEASDIMRFNSDSNSNYSYTALDGNPGSSRGSNQTSCFLGNTYSAQYMKVINIFNYSNSTTYKTLISRSGYQGGTYAVSAWVNLWRSTNAITSLTIGPNSGTMSSGMTISLYGIQVGTAAQKAQGGNIVTSDGTYVYHTFTSSGAFIPSQGLTVDYLVVAGGGGSGYSRGGGGGAGGLRCTVGATGGGGSLESALSLSSGKSYPVIVGAGGVGGTSGTPTASNGSDSIFSTITSTGGGRGGAGGSNGAVGGSGGGSGLNGGGTSAGTANQGYAGGSNGNDGGGGGGGASAVGSNGSGNNGGNGGAGVTTSISGTSTTYAGGGGGAGTSGGTSGSGGSGGGGSGGPSDDTPGVAGTANSGGGGGGGRNQTAAQNGGNGGSGIVIIRYAI